MDGELTKGMMLWEAVKKMWAPGTPVEISIFRKGESEILDLTLVRAVISTVSGP
ncbi:MAG: hypothetical protein R2861_02600 [Desulfobacterales bacterium]